MLHLQFLGATETVTGSKYLLSSNDSNILVDCGLFQGFKQLRLRNWAPLPLDAKKLKAVLLTHAHIDHSGYIPLLVRNGFQGPIYCTRATAALCRILLPDSGYLQEEEARFANKHGFSKHQPALPLYTESDAGRSLRQLEPIDWNQIYRISEGFSFKFFRAGHLLGAASIRVEYKKNSILFSGDVGRPRDPLMYPPSDIEPADFIVAESTYGDRLHDSANPKDQLRDVVKKTVQRGGSLIIPSFAVGRAQLVLYYLHQLRAENSIPTIPIFLNSPMAQSANEIFESYHLDHQLAFLEAQKICDEAIYVNSVEESKRLNYRQEPAIIIAASGMATGGRVLHHLKRYVSDPKNTILFVGFQAGGTRGESMIHGAQTIKIHGELWPVRAEILQMDHLSAHADQREMLNWLKSCPRTPQKVFLTHGEPLALDRFRIKIEEDLRWPCHIPYYLERQNLSEIS